MSETLVNQIDNKNIYASRAVADEDGTNIKTSYALKSEIPTVPTMKNLVAGTNVTITEGANDVTISASGGGTLVQADWDENDPQAVDYIKNKPNLASVAMSGAYSDLSGTPTIPTVDQTYNSSSTNAQSGVAVASALSGKEDDFDAGEGLEFTTDGQGNRVLQVEGPVDIVAGPGIVIDNPDGNTLRVSSALYVETVIWTPPTGYETANNYAITLTESIHNFSEIAVYCKAQRTTGLQDTSKNVYPVSDSGNTMFADGSTSNHWNNNNNDNGFFYQGIDIRLTDATGYIGGNYRWGITNGTTTWECSRPADNNSIYLHPYKIVGIHRVASN